MNWIIICVLFILWRISKIGDKKGRGSSFDGKSNDNKYFGPPWYRKKRDK